MNAQRHKKYQIYQKGQMEIYKKNKGLSTQPYLTAIFETNEALCPPSVYNIIHQNTCPL